MVTAETPKRPARSVTRARPISVDDPGDLLLALAREHAFGHVGGLGGHGISPADLRASWADEQLRLVAITYTLHRLGGKCQGRIHPDRKGSEFRPGAHAGGTSTTTLWPSRRAAVRNASAAPPIGNRSLTIARDVDAAGQHQGDRPRVRPDHPPREAQVEALAPGRRRGDHGGVPDRDACHHHRPGRTGEGDRRPDRVVIAGDLDRDVHPAPARRGEQRGALLPAAHLLGMCAARTRGLDPVRQAIGGHDRRRACGPGELDQRAARSGRSRTPRRSTRAGHDRGAGRGWRRRAARAWRPRRRRSRRAAGRGSPPARRRTRGARRR